MIAKNNIKFKYYEAHFPEFKCYDGRPHKVTEVMIIVDEGQYGVPIVGHSYCDPNDKFVKIEGRKRALRRAFDQDPEHKILTKQDRRKICEQVLGKYFKMQIEYRVIDWTKMNSGPTGGPKYTVVQIFPGHLTPEIEAATVYRSPHHGLADHYLLELKE